MACDLSDLKYCYWTIFLKRSYKTFTISACNKDAVFSAKGAYRYLRNVDFAMTLECLHKTITLDLNTDSSPDAKYFPFDPTAVAGPIKSGLATIGFCILKNSHQKDEPIIKIKSENQNWCLEAHRSDPSLIDCPLLVYGLQNFEMILGDYKMLSDYCSFSFPKDPRSKNIVGLCKTAIQPLIPFENTFETVTLVVSIFRLYLKDYYMRVHAA